eukprot:PhM_4_TR18053/c4_g1_i12/m.40937/K00939/adk, AK; adenylate kinase
MFRRSFHPFFRSAIAATTTSGTTTSAKISGYAGSNHHVVSSSYVAPTTTATTSLQRNRHALDLSAQQQHQTSSSSLYDEDIFNYMASAAPTADMYAAAASLHSPAPVVVATVPTTSKASSSSSTPLCSAEEEENVSDLWDSMDIVGHGIHACTLEQRLQEVASHVISRQRLQRCFEKAGICNKHLISLKDFRTLMARNNFTTLKDLLLHLTDVVPANELQDAQLLFEKALGNVLRDDLDGDRRGLVFPKNVYFLCGAPGAGKGTTTRAIMRTRGISVAPIVVSDLLSSPEAMRKKENGEMFSDSYVIEVLLRELLKPQYANGVIVDGFPRTSIQAQCIPLLYNTMMSLRSEFASDPAVNFRRPVFHMVVLFVTQDVSLKRQSIRGTQDQHLARVHREWLYHNPRVARATDIHDDLAKKRYRDFRHKTVPALQKLSEMFPFHVIDANGSVTQVVANIEKELQYQSELELDHDVFELVDEIALASDVVAEAHHKLARRLEGYRAHHFELFDQALRLVTDEFVHILQSATLSGKAIVRSEHPILQTGIGKSMVLDILAERGYNVTLDQERVQRVQRFELWSNRHEDAPVLVEEVNVAHFTIEFPRPPIRAAAIV